MNIYLVDTINHKLRKRDFMKRVIYIALTLASALSLGGCSSAITTKDLTMIEEAESQKTEPSASTQLTESNDKIFPTTIPEATKETTTSITTSPELFDMTIELEGNKEIVPVREYISSLGYQILMDEARFTYESLLGTDIYTAPNPDNSVYPDIYIKITKTDKSDQTDYFEDLKQQLLQVNPQTKELSDAKIGSYDVDSFHLSSGNEYNSAIKKLAVIDTITAYYTIETQYFLEAAEGYGSRIRALLDTFIIND
jgi:hypothetical protein